MKKIIFALLFFLPVLIKAQAPYRTDTLPFGTGAYFLVTEPSKVPINHVYQRVVPLDTLEKYILQLIEDAGGGTFTLNGITVNSGDDVHLELASSTFEAQGTDGSVFHGSTSANPYWGPVDLSSEVSEDLGVEHLNGGSGASSTTFWRGDGTWATPGGGGVTPAALTKTDDTNVTLTLGGTPSTALLQATSITAGWSGQLAPSRGGTGQNNSSATGIGQWSSGTYSVTPTVTGAVISGATNTITNIGNSSLTNSSVTINGSSVSLGGAVTIPPVGSYPYADNLYEIPYDGGGGVQDFSAGFGSAHIVFTTDAGGSPMANTILLPIAPPTGNTFIFSDGSAVCSTYNLMLDAGTGHIYYNNTSSHTFVMNQNGLSVSITAIDNSNWKVIAISESPGFIHDSTLTGLGTGGNPLSVNNAITSGRYQPESGDENVIFDSANWVRQGDIVTVYGVGYININFNSAAYVAFADLPFATTVVSVGDISGSASGITVDVLTNYEPMSAVVGADLSDRVAFYAATTNAGGATGNTSQFSYTYTYKIQ